MGAETMKAIREETVENCLQELQRRSNFHNVPELTYAILISQVVHCLDHVDDAVPSGLGVLLFPKPDVIVPKLPLIQPVL